MAKFNLNLKKTSVKLHFYIFSEVQNATGQYVSLQFMSVKLSCL